MPDGITTCSWLFLCVCICRNCVFGFSQVRRKAPAPEGITAASSNDRLSRGLAAAGLVRAHLCLRLCALVSLCSFAWAFALYNWGTGWGLDLFTSVSAIAPKVLRSRGKNVRKWGNRSMGAKTVYSNFRSYSLGGGWRDHSKCDCVIPWQTGCSILVIWWQVAKKKQGKGSDELSRWWGRWRPTVHKDASQ